MKTEMDVNVCRGFYLSANNKEHPIVKQFGTDVIVLARSLNECWTRFVFIKELMHLFDKPQEATDTGAAFETLLGELTGPPITRSEQYLSEIECFWMALAALCPENVRQELVTQRASGHIDDYEIALKLMIPKQFIPSLCSPQFPAILRGILAQ